MSWLTEMQLRARGCLMVHLGAHEGEKEDVKALLKLVESLNYNCMDVH